MLGNVDLFTIATSGVNASNRLLQITGNNIANVNTDGYVREKAVVSGGVVGGVGEITTERVISIFAQNQMRRDITQVGELEKFYEKVYQLDNMLANEANSMASGMSQFFGAMQTAADDPTNLTSREIVLSQAESLLGRMSMLSDFMQNKEEELNLEFTTQVDYANDLIRNISDLNQAIMVAQGNDPRNAPVALLNERDKAINDLASMMAIETRETNGNTLVNLKSGESLVLEDGSFNLIGLSSDADLQFKQLELTTNFNGAKNETSIRIDEQNLGGSLGGLFRFRDEVLGAAQRDVGQIALAMADAVNTQNRLGMDLDLQLGGDIFAMPVTSALPYEGTPSNLALVGRVEAGQGREFTDADYKITVDAIDGSGLLNISVELLEGNGEPKRDENNNPIIHTLTSINPTNGFTSIPGGLEIDFQSASGYSVGNEFLLQPSKTAASEITLATKRPEDLAFASPIRIEHENLNNGDASVSEVKVTNTDIGSSGFNGAGDLLTNAPARITFTSANSYEVFDSNNISLGSVNNATDLENLLSKAGANRGYDFSLTGVPSAGDTFSIEYNTDGIYDNQNALALAGLQDEGLVQMSYNSTSQPRALHDSYSSLVGRVGQQSASTSIALDAAEVMKTQSTNWFESNSAVSLDEEAANLIRFQQSYAAAARIISTAQDLFNTILSAAR